MGSCRMQRLGLADVLPYFKKSEHQQRGANEYHATDGPLWVSDLPSKHELADAFIGAGHELGSPLNDDFNGASQEGAGYQFHHPGRDVAGAPPPPMKSPH